MAHVCPVNSSRDPEEVERGEKAQIKGCNQRGVSGERTTPAPELTGAQPEVVWLSAPGLKVCGYPLCPSRSFLLKTEMPTQPWRNGLPLPLLRPPNVSEQLLGDP
ncbi:rCG26255, partial [Rattus norvegicus]